MSVAFDDWAYNWVHLVHVDARPEEPHAEDSHKAETPRQPKQNQTVRKLAHKLTTTRSLYLPTIGPRCRSVLSGERCVLADKQTADQEKSDEKVCARHQAVFFDSHY